MRCLRVDFHLRIRVNFDKTNSPTMERFVTEVGPVFGGDERFSLDFHPVGKWGGPQDDALDLCDADSVETVKLAHQLCLGHTLNRAASPPT